MDAGIIIGCVFGFLVLLAIIIIMVVGLVLYRRNKLSVGGKAKIENGLDG